MESVSANNCRSVFASSTRTTKETFNCCAEALGIGIRFIAVIIGGARLNITKIPDRRYQIPRIG